VINDEKDLEVLDDLIKMYVEEDEDVRGVVDEDLFQTFLTTREYLMQELVRKEASRVKEE
jgi:hypothetical protein